MRILSLMASTCLAIICAGTSSTPLSLLSSLSFSLSFSYRANGTPMPKAFIPPVSLSLSLIELANELLWKAHFERESAPLEPTRSLIPQGPIMGLNQPYHLSHYHTFITYPLHFGYTHITRNTQRVVSVGSVCDGGSVCVCVCDSCVCKVYHALSQTHCSHTTYTHTHTHTHTLPRTTTTCGHAPLPHTHYYTHALHTTHTYSYYHTPLQTTHTRNNNH